MSARPSRPIYLPLRNNLVSDTSILQYSAGGLCRICTHIRNGHNIFLSGLANTTALRHAPYRNNNSPHEYESYLLFFILVSEHYHIFVGDLSPEIDTQTLRDAFAQFGEIS